MTRQHQVQLAEAVRRHLAANQTMTLNQLDGIIFTIYDEAQLVREASNKKSKAAKRVKVGESVTDKELHVLVGLGMKQKRYSFLRACKNRKRPWLVREGDILCLAKHGDTQVD